MGTRAHTDQKSSLFGEGDWHEEADSDLGSLSPAWGYGGGAGQAPPLSIPTGNGLGGGHSSRAAT